MQTRSRSSHVPAVTKETAGENPFVKRARLVNNRRCYENPNGYGLAGGVRCAARFPGSKAKGERAAKARRTHWLARSPWGLAQVFGFRGGLSKGHAPSRPGDACSGIQ